MEVISGNTTVDIAALNEKINRESAFVDVLNMELGKTIVGQKYMLERLLLAMLSNGHILLEGVPGLAKTLANKMETDPGYCIVLYCIRYCAQQGLPSRALSNRCAGWFLPGHPLADTFLVDILFCR